MQSHYEINVSHMGRHLFATAPRSATYEAAARLLVSLLRERFTSADGYEITCTHWQGSGQVLDL